MLRRLIIAAMVLGLIALGAFWFLTRPAVVDAGSLGPHTPNPDNGRTMFFAGGCASCHAIPNQDDRTRLGGGLALKSPFGTFHVPNISSDRNDGIGAWSEAQFVTAMLKGTSPAGEHYYPAFPYTSYQRMRIEDVRDLFAHIKTLPAVPGKVRDHELPFPFNVRLALGGWKLLYLDGEAFKPDPSQPAEWNRGAYLVNGPGHCAECHSPRDPLGGINADSASRAGPIRKAKAGCPTSRKRRLKDYAVEDIVDVLATGLMPNGDTVGGPMVPVVRNTSQLSDADRKAMAVYIKSLPPVEGPKPSPTKTTGLSLR